MENQEVIRALAALAQPVRLQVFRALVVAGQQGMTPGTMADALDIPANTLSFHLKELANAGLIADRREGRFIWYRADLAAMGALVGYLTEHCCSATGSADCGPACAPATCGPSPTRTRSKR